MQPMKFTVIMYSLETHSYTHTKTETPTERSPAVTKAAENYE